MRTYASRSDRRGLVVKPNGKFYVEPRSNGNRAYRGLKTSNFESHGPVKIVFSSSAGERTIDPYDFKQVRAYQMAASPTKAEQVLSGILYGFPFKFKPQQVLCGFIPDFYCEEKKLVIEADGNTHRSDSAKAYDRRRTAAFRKIGVRVLRLWNSEISNHQETVKAKIRKALEACA